MVYQWKIPGLYKVDAQTAGDELERIHAKNGCLEPAAVVEESRPEDAPLHSLFEWDDPKAAEKYREIQAGTIIRAIVAVDAGGHSGESVRAFVHVQDTYQPMSVVVKSRDLMEELQGTALRELQAFQRKYRSLQKVSAFKPVFKAIDVVQGNLTAQI